MASEEVLLRLRTQGGRAVQADLAGVSHATRAVGDDAVAAGRKSGRAFGWITSGIARAVAATGGLYALGRGFGFAFDEAEEAAKVGRQTAAVIRSTGGVANVTRRDVEALAGAISDYAGIDDEAIQAAGNLLLTFTRVRNEVGESNDVFDQATAAAIDMSVALGGDARSAAVMLGKALNDPAAGYSRLMRSGVSFDESQIRRIRNLQREGDLLGAQKIILAEVAREFGGSARAQATNVDKLRVTIGNIAEAAGGLFLPAVERAAAGVRDFIEEVEHGRGTGGDFRDTIVAIAHGAADLWRWIKQNKNELLTLSAAVGAGVIAWKSYMAIARVVELLRLLKAAGFAATAAQLGLNAAMIANPVGLVIAGLAGIAVGLVVAYRKVGWFRDGVDTAWSWIKDHWPLLVGILTGPIGLAVGVIIDNFGRVKGAFSGLFDGLAGAARSAFDAVKGIVIDAINWLIQQYNRVAGPLPGIDPIDEVFIDDVRRGYVARGLRTGRQRQALTRLLQPPADPLLAGASGTARGASASTTRRTINLNAPLFIEGREVGRAAARAFDYEDMWGRR